MSILSYYYISSVSGNMLDSLNDLQKNIKNESWEKARNSYSDVEKDWNKVQKYFPLLIAHSNLHELNMSITKISALLKIEEKKEIIPELEVAKKITGEISEEEKLSLRNIF